MDHGTHDLDSLLRLLADPAAPQRVSSLPTLSDLHAQSLIHFCEAFDTFPVERRRQLLRSLVELAETSFEVDFGAIYRHCLQDSDAMVRTTAIEGLWEDSSPALVTPLLQLLRADPSPQVRAAAATGLGSFVLAGQMEELDAGTAGKVADELLATFSLLGEAVDVRRRALESAAYSGSPQVGAALGLAYDEDDEAWRLSAVVGMGRTCNRRWSPILLEELESSSAAMRYQAAVACGETSLIDSVPILGRLLRDPDRQIAGAAIWALGQIGGVAARDLLLDLYEEADDETQDAIDEALAEQDLLEGMPSFSMVDVEDLDDMEFLLDHEERAGETLDEGGLADLDESG
ncbi:MAG TPA: HEAT repeat domain-containing protein [Anaerolineae bacterium]|nr:HEAT repeat domain-containing protein [Anaerolineae bacterium]